MLVFVKATTVIRKASRRTPDDRETSPRPVASYSAAKLVIVSVFPHFRSELIPSTTPVQFESHRKKSSEHWTNVARKNRLPQKPNTSMAKANQPTKQGVSDQSRDEVSFDRLPFRTHVSACV